MIFDLDEFQEAKEKKKLTYHAPLPVKKQRTTHYRYQRNGQVKQYTKEEIENYERSCYGSKEHSRRS